MFDERDHLDPHQFEALLRAGVHSTEKEQETELSAREHLSNCDKCKSLLNMYEQIGHKLSELSSVELTPHSAECPPPQQIVALSCGFIEDAERDRILQHVLYCGHCMHAFRQLVSIHADPTTESEERFILKLQTSRPEVQVGLAQRLAGRANEARFEVQKASTQPKFKIPRTIAYAALSVAALLLFAIIGYRNLRFQEPSHVNELLAQAYSAQRTSAMRFPGAKFGPLRQQRGDTHSQMEKPASLLEAEALIAKRLPIGSNQAGWLQAKGRADILDGNYAAGITALNRALEWKPEDPGLQADLAMAYFSRAEVQNSAADYAMAADLLGRALRHQPDEPVFLFNRAIAFTRLQLIRQAIDDWNHYLHVDPSGPWSDEARLHLQQLIREQGESKSSRDLPFEIYHLLNSLGQSSPAESSPRSLEEVQTFLVKHIPELQSTHSISNDSLVTIAKLNLSKNDDRWLSDFLRGARGKGFVEAVDSLRKAIVASEHADYALSLQQATLAEQRFSRLRNRAGQLRAQFEKVFAAHFSNDAQQCVIGATHLSAKLPATKYQWIESQTKIELGICLNSLGQLDDSSRALTQATAVAEAVDYNISRSRAQIMSALVNWEKGDRAVAWQQLREVGLRCARTGCPRMTAYSVYANMDNFAEDARLWHLQTASAREGVLTLALDPDLVMRAVEHNRLAKASILAGDSAQAADNLTLAAQLLVRAPQTPITKHYEAGINVDRAKLALDRGEISDAAKYLDQVRPILPDINDHYILTDYYINRSRIAMTQGNLGESQSSLQWAIAIAEQELSSLNSDRDRIAWIQVEGDAYRQWIYLELLRLHPDIAFQVWQRLLSVSLSDRLGRQRRSNDDSDVFVLNKSHQAPPRLPDLPAIESGMLSGGVGMLSFASISGHVAVWFLDQQGLTFAWLDETAVSVARSSHRFTVECADPGSDLASITRDGRSLYQTLVAPFSERVASSRTLIVNGDSEFADIPWQALVDSTGQYLIQHHVVVRIQALNSGFHNAPSQPVSSKNHALVVAVSRPALPIDSESTVVPLNEAVPEGQAVSAKFAIAKLFQDDSAQFVDIKREIRTATVFHYVGHSIASNSMGFGLVLGKSALRPGNGVLDAQLVRSLNAPGLRLVVLSACRTEGSDQKGLSDADGLALAFLNIGVHEVIASRWDVDSHQTLSMMTSFYDHLVLGEPPEDSLRTAELSLLANSETRHPYYWAAFGNFRAS